ncbi:MAG: saccharopine dehydrogenase family protein [Promethearchaeota archaeon]
MSRITVLGGCGVVGRVAARTLKDLPDFDEIIIADINTEAAELLADELGEACTPFEVDVLQPKSIQSAIQGSDVVLNCVGPFYKFGPPILQAVIKAGIPYVDVCDDVEPTQALLAMDKQAKKAGMSALIGMGSSPGVSNLLVKFATEQLLERVDAIDIFHAHGGEPIEGAAVIAHRIHAMTSEIPMFLDGKHQKVRFFGKDGVALREEVVFHQIGTHLCYPYPHPETITLPNYIQCKRVTNKGTVLPDRYFQFIMNIVESGLTGEDPVMVKGLMVVPRDFAIAYIIEERKRILKETKFGEQRGCVKIVVSGFKGGKPHQYIFSLWSVREGMGEGTGIPAALGATLMQRGKIPRRGVFPPEAAVNPMEFLGVMQELLNLDQMTGAGSPLLIQSVDADGNIKELFL